MSDPFADLPRGHFAAILADPPWHYPKQDGRGLKYNTLSERGLVRLPVDDLAAEDCVLFIWAVWPHLEQSLKLCAAWGFEYKTCAFDWAKANNTQIHLFDEELDPRIGMGNWTRANTEPCLLATRGKPKRLNADVRQGIIEPRREHSRKPDCVHERIERLVAGPYLELFARQRRPGWTSWGNETDKFTTSAPSSEWEAMWARKFDHPERI